MSDKKHPYKKVKSWFSEDRTIEIDEEIVELIQLFWDEEFFTWNSCQDNNGTIWIEIDLDDFKELVEISYLYRNESDLYYFLETCDTSFCFQDNGNSNENDEWIDGEEHIYSTSLRFPKEEKDEFITLWKEVFNPANKAMVNIINDLEEKFNEAIKINKE